MLNAMAIETAQVEDQLVSTACAKIHAMVLVVCAFVYFFVIQCSSIVSLVFAICLTTVFNRLDFMENTQIDFLE